MVGSCDGLRVDYRESVASADEYAFGRQAISARAPRFLDVSEHLLWTAGMDDGPDVGMIISGSECVGGHQELVAPFHPSSNGSLLQILIHLCMIKDTGDADRIQRCDYLGAGYRGRNEDNASVVGSLRKVGFACSYG